MVDQAARRALFEPQEDRVPVERDVIGRSDAQSQCRTRAVHPEPAGDDRSFHLAARTQPGACKNLVKPLGARRPPRPRWVARSLTRRARSANRARTAERARAANRPAGWV